MQNQKKDVKYIPESRSWMVDGRIISENDLSEQEILELQALCEGTNQILYGNRLDERKSQQIL